MNSLEKILHALPTRFDFYHMGEVTLGSPAIEVQDHEDCLEGKNAVGFRLSGDGQIWMILLLDQALDSSIYQELGNIIASHTATQLSKRDSLSWMISAPQPVQNEQLKKILETTPAILRRTYTHIYEQTLIPIETLFLPVSTEGLRYA